MLIYISVNMRTVYVDIYIYVNMRTVYVEALGLAHQRHHVLGLGGVTAAV